MGLRKQTLTPADLWVPTQSCYSSSGLTSTSSLFSSFLFAFFAPPLLRAEFVTFSGMSFLRDVASPIPQVPTISCPSCRLTACSLLRAGRQVRRGAARPAALPGFCLLVREYVEDLASSLEQTANKYEKSSRKHCWQIIFDYCIRLYSLLLEQDRTQQTGMMKWIISRWWIVSSSNRNMHPGLNGALKIDHDRI